MLIKGLPTERVELNVPVRSGERKIRKTSPGKAEEAERRGKNALELLNLKVTPSQRRCSERREELLTPGFSQWNIEPQSFSWYFSKWNLATMPGNLFQCLLKYRFLGPILIFSH